MLPRQGQAKYPAAGVFQSVPPPCWPTGCRSEHSLSCEEPAPYLGGATALVLYNNIKFLAKNKQPGAQAAYDDLAQRFPGGGSGRPAKALKG